MFQQDDLRLGSLFSNDSQNGRKIALIGYPIDVGVIRNGGRPGAAEGPDFIRSLINKKGSVINSEYGLSIKNIEIKDFGDTNIKDTDLKVAHLNHQNLVESALNEGYIPIIIGGGNDQSFPNFKALSKRQKDTDHMLVINIDAHLDVRPLLPGNEPHSGSPFRQMLESDINHSLNFIEFACQGSQCSSQHVDYVQKKGGQIVWLRDIHGSLMEYSKINSTISTFEQLINNDKYTSLFVSFDIDSIRSSDCPGVSCPGTLGITADEALSICYYSGKCKNIKMLDISEFNPKVESYRTGTLIINMIYYFLLGLADQQVENLSLESNL